jgi:NAD/NADP transhydrogenase beta subunit
MSKTLKLIISIIGTISGWLMAGIGFTVRLGHPINTILFLGGLGLMIFSGYICWFEESRVACLQK